jgi:hypothetical protein
MIPKGTIIAIVVSVFSLLYYAYISFDIDWFDKEQGLGMKAIGGTEGKIERFVPGSNGAPLNYGMGPYSNKYLQNKKKPYWRHPPSNLELKTQPYSPKGTPLPIKRNVSGPTSYGPTVDGTPNTPKDMFMFAHNQCKPGCCPSTYSCDHGCVCTTEQQRKFINSRGENRHGSIKYY